MTSFYRKNPLLTALILSVLLIHLPLFLFVFFFGDRMAAQNPQDVLKKNAVIVDLRGVQDLPVADIAKPARQERPDKATVQSLYDSRVDHETVSNGRKPRSAPGPTSSKPTTASNSPAMPVPNRTPVPKRAGPKDAPSREIAKSESSVPKPSHGSLQDELKALQNQQRSKEAQDFKKFASKSEFFAPPTNFSGGGGGEFLPDFKVGTKTYVNALANPQVSYYVELKRKFKLTWDPVPALRSQINQITKGKITVVMGVSLDAAGKLSELRVLKGSGLSAYDAEARRTVTASAPFSKPPPYLLKDGEVRMAWTFVVYL
jgi:TonB family protein